AATGQGAPADDEKAAVLDRFAQVHEVADLRQIVEVDLRVELDGDLDDHVVVDERAVLADHPALADASLVAEHAGIRLADPAILATALGRHGGLERGNRRGERIQMQQLARAVEAQRLPAAEQLDGLEHAPALLAAGQAAGAETDRPAIHPPRVAAPAPPAAQLA